MFRIQRMPAELLLNFNKKFLIKWGDLHSENNRLMLTPSLPHAVPQFHHFAVRRRRRLVEGLDSVLFYSRAVLGRVLQMMPFNL